MSVATTITPADVASRVKPLQVNQVVRYPKRVPTPEERETAKRLARDRWVKNDRLRRSLRGRLQGCDRRYAGPLRKQLAEVERLLRQDSWAAPKKS